MIKPNQRLVMIGAGGHAKVCYDIAQKMNKWNEIIILDDNLDNNYFEISGSISDIGNYIDNSDFFVAIGDNETREKITSKLINKTATIVTLIHPQATIASNVEIEIGTVVMAGVVINSATKIGESCIINTSSSIDHDNTIGNFVHISPGVHLAGAVVIGNRVWIGIGSQTVQHISIGENTVVGAGTTVLNNISSNCIAVGSPAKVIDTKKNY